MCCRQGLSFVVMDSDDDQPCGAPGAGAMASASSARAPIVTTSTLSGQSCAAYPDSAAPRTALQLQETPLAAHHIVSCDAVIGPKLIVVIIATPQGRWHKQLQQSKSSAARKLREELLQSCADSSSFRSAAGINCSSSGVGSSSISISTQRVVGIAVINSWELLNHATDDFTSSLCNCLLQTYRRSRSLHFLHHTFLASAALERHSDISCDVYSSDPARLGQMLINDLGSERVSGATTCFGTDCSIGTSVFDTVCSWQQRYGPNLDVVAWPAFFPVAFALACGQLRKDVTALVPRDSFREWEIPVLPPRSLRRKLQNLPGAKAATVTQFAAQELGQRSGSSWKRKRLQLGDAENQLNAVEASCEVRNQQQFKAHALKMLKFFYPRDWRHRAAELAGQHKSLSRAAIERSRVRFDVAAMLWQRHQAGQNSFFRYISSDASPQMSQSHEVFVSVERVALRTALHDLHLGGVAQSSFTSRLLPLRTLGQGKTVLQDKIAAHIHQTWLEYGPRIEDVRVALGSVRQVLTDMGVEFGMANYPDVVSEVLRDVTPSCPDSFPTGQYLFPFAIQVPGVLHVLDWVVRQVVETLPFWPAWQATAKRICQYVHSQNHRSLLQRIIRDKAPDQQQASELCGQLDKGMTRFAQWRWKTLHFVVSDLIRIEDALKFVGATCDDFSKALAIRDCSAANALRAAFLDDWSQVRAVAFVIRRIFDFMSWVQGCDCHEEQLRAGQQVSCSMKGCRCRTLAHQVAAVVQQLQEDRASLLPGQFGAVDVACINAALTQGILCIRAKLHWVSELPYLVWQACYYFTCSVRACCARRKHVPRLQSHSYHTVRARLVRVWFAVLLVLVFLTLHECCVFARRRCAATWFVILRPTTAQLLREWLPCTMIKCWMSNGQRECTGCRISCCLQTATVWVLICEPLLQAVQCQPDFGQRSPLIKRACWTTASWKDRMPASGELHGQLRPALLLGGQRPLDSDRTSALGQLLQTAVCLRECS